jgi:hypothetical protein
MEFTSIINAEGRARADNFVHRVAKPHVYIVTHPRNPHISITKFAEKIQGRSRFLAECELQRVLFATLLERFFNVMGHAVKTVGGTCAVNALMRPLMIIIGHPVIEPLARVGEGRENRFFQELRPDGFPEPFDFAQCHGMVRSAANMRYALPVEFLLEAGLASPRSELAAVVG